VLETRFARVGKKNYNALFFLRSCFRTAMLTFTHYEPSSTSIRRGQCDADVFRDRYLSTNGKRKRVDVCQSH